MNLLQIHEPGQTPDPHADEVAIGIDLGTTHFGYLNKILDDIRVAGKRF